MGIQDMEMAFPDSESTYHNSTEKSIQEKSPTDIVRLDPSGSEWRRLASYWQSL